MRLHDLGLLNRVRIAVNRKSAPVANLVVPGDGAELSARGLGPSRPW